MPCEILIFEVEDSILCPHSSVACCADCDAELCAFHKIECSVCAETICSDCLIEHRFNHDQAEQKLKAGA